MKYPKAFEKWYKKAGYVDKVFPKQVMFESWQAAAKAIEKKIKRLDKGARVYDGHWQHEHTDWTLEYIEGLYK